MAKYYATVAALPNLGVEDRKLPFSSAFFVEELKSVLSSRDFFLLGIVRLMDENHFLIRFLENDEEAPDKENLPTLFSYEEVRKVLTALRERDSIPKNNLPPYFVDFLRDTQVEQDEEGVEEEDWLQDEDEKRKSYPLHLEDKLSEYYYNYAMSCGNRFVEEWARFNLNIKNVFAASIGRKLAWNPADYVVGDSEIERKLKESNAPNFGLSEDDIAFLPQLFSILNETDITRRERMIDLLRWNWLEDYTFDRVFDIEAILCYFLQLRIVERWTELNEKTGEETFRSIVAALKKESNESLDEFKRNQKK